MSASANLFVPKIAMAQRLMPIASLLCIGASAAPQPKVFDPYAQGAELSRRLMHGDIVALERALSPTFLAGVGKREGLERMVKGLRAQAGREEQVLRQVAYLEAGHVTYYRVSRFERMPNLTARWVFDRDYRVAALSVRPTPATAPTRHAAYSTAVPFLLPFAAPAGGQWYVAWGGDDHISNKHVVARDQRFAYDFVVTHEGNIFESEGTKNEEHYCWNEALYAPAGGRVVSAIGDVADNSPGTSPPTAPPAGNHVVIDHGNGSFSMIAHLRRGSLAVHPGQKVTSQTLVGRCGNSGRSELPHVHYHMQTAAAYGQGEGLPVAFSGYFVGGQYITEGKPVRGDFLTPLRRGFQASSASPMKRATRKRSSASTSEANAIFMFR